MFAALQGYKTHILIVAYVAFKFFTNEPLEGDVILGNVDSALVLDALQAGIVSTLKAAWDRYAARNDYEEEE